MTSRPAQARSPGEQGDEGSRPQGAVVPTELTEPAVLAFTADLEAVLDVHGRKLNCAQFIHVLTGALDRAYVDACEPEGGPTKVRARLSHVLQSLQEQAMARHDPAMPVLTAEVVEGLRDYAEACFCSDERADRVEAHGLFMLCDWQDARRLAAPLDDPSGGDEPTSANETLIPPPEGGDTVSNLLDRISTLCTSFNDQVHDADDTLGQINQLAYAGMAALRPERVREARALYVPMPLNAGGGGPADPSETVRVEHQVWDASTNETLCTAKDEAIARQIAEALAAPGGDTVTVPREPTLEMQKAYFDVIDRNMKRVETDATFGRFANHKLAYAAMIAAAPSTPAGKVGE